MTVLPQALATELALPPVGESTVIGFDERPVTVMMYAVRIGIQEFPLVPVPVLASLHEPIILLGRDVLNRYRISLDGPRMVVEIAGGQNQ